ncbi:hypothetical protein HPB52_007943 [Rhipicephalus sanguineus]|uniref:Uncharacterized protein n=1 Tax=Rhipicephalus sanguineus TaxID=34632 RepID=A0A9D4PYR8_RHISA|nr:hypothetical protein HPB52_007943 [Rhipicephalus sanguineus]
MLYRLYSTSVRSSSSRGVPTRSASALGFMEPLPLLPPPPFARGRRRPTSWSPDLWPRRSYSPLHGTTSCSSWWQIAREDSAGDHGVRRVGWVRQIGAANDKNKKKSPGVRVCGGNSGAARHTVGGSGSRPMKKKRRNTFCPHRDQLSLLQVPAPSMRRTERLTSLVSEAERNTEILFSDVYAERVAVEARAPVRRLFRALRHRLGLPLGASDGAESARKDSEDDPVDAFFGELFPLVYFHTVNPRLADFSDDYKACLRGAQGRLRPFGDAPLRLKGSLAESLGAVRTVLRATRLALEVVNASSSPPDDAESHCSRALARALGCGACTSLPPTTVGKVAKRNGKASTLAPTCSGLCVNAARGGCLAALEDLEAPWNDLVSSLHRLLPRLVGAYSLDEALSLLDSRVSEAVIHAMENGPELVKRVKLECGDPRRRPGGANRTELPAATGRRTSGATLRGADAALRSRQRELLRQLSTSRTLFSSLAGAVCDPDVVAPPPCWNGIQIGRYVKPVAAPGIAAQHENPEARHQVSTWDSWLDTHARRLKEMTTEILSHKVSMMPESDSYVMEGSGSGAWGGEDTSDDEDFDSGSGSGYGPGEESPTPTTHVTTSTTPRPKAGGSATPHVAAAALIVAVVCSLLSTFAT